MSAWIRMIPVEEAGGTLKAMYDKVKTPHGTVDNVMSAHSLRPHTMEGHVVAVPQRAAQPGEHAAARGSSRWSPRTSA